MAADYLVKLSLTTSIAAGKLMRVVYNIQKPPSGSFAPTLVETDLSGQIITSTGVRKKTWSLEGVIYYGAAPDGHMAYADIEAIYNSLVNQFAFRDMRNAETYQVAIVNKARFEPRPTGDMCYETGAVWRIGLELRET